MLPQKTILEKTITGRQYLENKGLKPEMYFLSVDGKMQTQEMEILPGQEVQAIPIVKGG